MAGRPRKDKDVPENDENVEAVEKTNLPKTIQFWRYISVQDNYIEGSVPVAEVNAYIDAYKLQGYKLTQTQIFDKNRVGVAVFYVMELDE